MEKKNRTNKTRLAEYSKDGLVPRWKSVLSARAVASSARCTTMTSIALSSLPLPTDTRTHAHAHTHIHTQPGPPGPCCAARVYGARGGYQSSGAAGPPARSFGHRVSNSSVRCRHWSAAIVRGARGLVCLAAAAAAAAAVAVERAREKLFPDISVGLLFFSSRHYTTSVYTIHTLLVLQLSGVCPRRSPTNIYDYGLYHINITV